MTMFYIDHVCSTILSNKCITLWNL